ncbi:MAG: hypothetical protein DWI30_07035 [Chloroflexi bacterium]|nr:MAG: hypothetical protein DWI30_07035 [Chloroflexota bacterium]
MALKPPTQEQSLLELLRDSLRKAVRTWWHRRRRPKFGDAITHEAPAQSEMVDENQIAFNLEDNGPTAIIPPPPKPKPKSTPATPRTPVRNIVAKVTLPKLPQWSFPDITTTFTFDIWTWLFWAGLLLTVVLRFYRIDTLQGEMYGDIEIVQTYTKSVLRGDWPWYFSLSSGPLYHYMIAPLIHYIGTGFDQIKVASILTSLGIVALIMGTARQLSGRHLGVIALAIAGSGSWLLLFSRLGNSQIFVPLVSIGTVYALLRYINTQRVGWLYASALIATFGLYSYPQSFVVPPVMWLTVVVLWQTKVIRNRQDIVRYTLMMLFGSLPFIMMYVSNPDSITGNYISEKFETTDLAPSRIMDILGRGVGAYFTSGDNVFRSNPRGLAHIDIISSVLFVIGIASCFRANLRAKAPLLIVPFLLLHIPSLLVLRYPDQVPSASRSIGAAPFAYLFIAMGLYEIYNFLKGRWASVAGLVVLVVFGASLQQNINRYFDKYISSMPYGDVPIGRMIVKYADMLSPDTSVYIAGCCWRDTSPEPYFSQLQMQHPTMLKRFDPADTLTCDTLAQTDRPAVIIWTFDTQLPSPNVEACKDQFRPVLHTMPDGTPLFYSSALIGTAMPGVPPEPTPEINQETIVVTAPDNSLLPPPPPSGPATTDIVLINGVQAKVAISPIDTGSIPDLFDKNLDTLVRSDGMSAAFTLDLQLDQALPTKTVTFALGGMRNFVADLIVKTADGDQQFSQSFPTAESDQVVVFTLPSQLAITGLQAAITEQDVPSDVQTHIHVRGVDFAP